MSLEKIFVSIITSLFQSAAVTTVGLKQLDVNNKKLKLNFFIVLELYCLASFYFIPNQLRFISFVFVIALAMYYILKIKSKIVTVYAFNIEIIMAISEIIVSLILVIFGVKSDAIVSIMILNSITNILISILAIGLINLKFVKLFLKKFTNLISKNKSFVKYINLFFIVLYIIILKNGLEFLLKSNYYINIAFIIGVLVIMTIIMKNESKYDKLNEANKQMLNHVTKYEKIITDQGKANHEFKNQLMVIRGYAQMNSDKLIEYIDSIVDDTKKTPRSYLISQLNKFPDGGIKGLLYYKLSIMDDEKIRYELDIESGVKTKLDSLPTNMYKYITKILGVLLDNAIDASKKAKEKKIIISVTKEKSNVIFSISNTYKGKIDISKIGTGYTTKGRGHGYGIRLVKDIMSETSALQIKNELIDHYFVTTLKIEINQKKKK